MPNILKWFGNIIFNKDQLIILLLIQITKKIPRLKEDSFKYYEENKTNFLVSELRSSETLLLDANKYAKKLTVTEDEIKLS